MTRHRIRRGDYNRVLITETAPFETPIIFSNDGLYDLLSKAQCRPAIASLLLEQLVTVSGSERRSKPTIPYKYKIRKDANTFRRLFLLHPISQWKIRTFYETYEELILHYCSKSPATIRAPQSIASSFYSKGPLENANRYKHPRHVNVHEHDRHVRHASSFFAYRGFSRLHKFINSREFLSLEKQFSFVRTLDVSKCFDSIYTHSLSWAVKDKSFTKKHVSVSSTFAQQFDEVIRHGNHNETHGIPIGPEFSRIFAEVLFQAIDSRVIESLNDLSFRQDYEFRRYVDDVFIFARSESIANRVHTKYTDILMDFGLHVNSAKSTCTHRPFSTARSRLIHEAGQQANLFFDKFLRRSEETLRPKKINDTWKLTKSYLESVKTLCIGNGAGYDDIGPFLTAVFSERVKRLTLQFEILPDINEGSYVDAFIVLLDVMFFLFGVAPSVGSSYKLGASLILILRFCRRFLPSSNATVTQRIYDLISSLVRDYPDFRESRDVEGLIHLEIANVLLAARELGEEYLLATEDVEAVFDCLGKPTYFSIVSTLFYIRDSKQYEQLRGNVIKAAATRLKDLSDISENSEKAHLLLDLLWCPYVPEKHKSCWIRRLQITLGQSSSRQDRSSLLSGLTTGHAFVNWREIDLLNSLEKREQKAVY